MKTKCLIYVLTLMVIAGCKPDNFERTESSNNQQNSTNQNHAEHHPEQSSNVTYFGSFTKVGE